MKQTRKYRKNANISHLITVRYISDTEYFWEGDFLRVYSTLSHHMVEHLFNFFVLIYLSDTVYLWKISLKNIITNVSGTVVVIYHNDKFGRVY